MSQSSKRIPPGSAILQFAGDIVLPRLLDKTYAGLFRRFEILFAKLANLEKEDRFLKYKMLNALLLTSIAKKTEDEKERKHLFDLKNDLYINLANNESSRRKLAFKYLTSNHFRVFNYCDECKLRNESENLPRHKWRFCEKCTVDRKFFNVLSMYHRFDNGYMTLFLSNDQMERLQNLKVKKKGPLKEHKEEIRFQNYLYNSKNLDVFTLDSVLEMHKKLSTEA